MNPWIRALLVSIVAMGLVERIEPLRKLVKGA